MRNFFVSAVCVVIGTGVALNSWAANEMEAGGKSSDPSRARMKIEAPGISNESAVEIRTMLGNAVENGLSGDFSEFAANLTKANRERIVKSTDDSDIDMAGELYEDWSSRYSTVDWSSNDSLSTVFSGYHITRGADAKHADVHIPAVGGRGPLTLKLVNEGTIMDAWRIMVPQSKSGSDIRNALQKEIMDINNSKADWPNDPNMAAQTVASRILSTVAEPA